VTDEVIAKYIAAQNIEHDEDFKVDGEGHTLLSARLERIPLAGLRAE